MPVSKPMPPYLFGNVIIPDNGLLGLRINSSSKVCYPAVKHNILSGPFGGIAPGIEFKVVKILVCVHFAAGAMFCLRNKAWDTGKQFVKMEWFDQVIVGAGLPGLLTLYSAPGRARLTSKWAFV